MSTNNPLIEAVVAVLNTHVKEIIQEAADVEVHGDEDSAASYRAIDKIHAHIKAAGHTIHHDDKHSDNDPEKHGVKNPHVTAHYEMAEDRHSAHPSGFTIHPKAQHDKKLMSMVNSYHKKYGE